MFEKMFNPEALGRIYWNHQRVLGSLTEVGVRLNARFYRLEEAVLGLLLALASGESLLLVGPPGTAKSRIVRAFCEELGLLPEGTRRYEPGERVQGDEAYFEYLLTEFTEPSELFGFYNFQEVQNGNLERLEENTLQRAQVVFLDEVFNASSAILNSLLSVMHEGILHDREKRIGVALECLVGATNFIPQRTDLLAFRDRFLLRCEVDNLRPRREAFDAYRRDLGDLIYQGWRESYGEPSEGTRRRRTVDEAKLVFKDLAGLRKELGELSPNRESFGELAYLIDHLRHHGLTDMSNRRVIKMCFVMAIHRLLRAARSGEKTRALMLGKEERDLIRRYFLDHRDGAQEDEVFKSPAPREGRK